MILKRFGEWFGSPAGVIQTFVLVNLVAIAEHLFPHLDKGGFQFLYWLTWYSAITQPVLAYVNGKDVDRLQVAVDAILTLERRIDDLLESRE
jgi:hypothetical protein